MTTVSYPVRMFGGRQLSVTFDSSAGTLTIAGQSVTIADLSSDLQTAWSDVVALSSTSVQTSGLGAFGGNDIGQVVGSILDADGTWRTAVQAALANVIDQGGNL